MSFLLGNECLFLMKHQYSNIYDILQFQLFASVVFHAFIVVKINFFGKVNVEKKKKSTDACKGLIHRLFQHI